MQLDKKQDIRPCNSTLQKLLNYQPMIADISLVDTKVHNMKTFLCHGYYENQITISRVIIDIRSVIEVQRQWDLIHKLHKKTFRTYNQSPNKPWQR